MVLDAFFRKMGAEKVKAPDELDRFIETIERFAPREYKNERSVHYYNYRMLEAYKGPLTGLLESLGRGHGRHSEAEFGREVFLRLKAFYDVKDTLSEEKAMADTALKRKFKDLFKYFYGKEGRWPSK
jgi:hypothetical protein